MSSIRQEQDEYSKQNAPHRRLPHSDVFSKHQLQGQDPPSTSYGIYLAPNVSLLWRKEGISWREDRRSILPVVEHGGEGNELSHHNAVCEAYPWRRFQVWLEVSRGQVHQCLRLRHTLGGNPFFNVVFLSQHIASSTCYTRRLPWCITKTPTLYTLVYNDPFIYSGVFHNTDSNPVARLRTA